tara:strand:- start:7136 stop:8611 length:1476 start_codon:yes stop_codon:yes gene_type:complete
MINFNNIIKDIEDTKIFIENLCQIIELNDVIILNGKIGSGKTTLARHIINRILQIDISEIVSPTFNLYQVYENNNQKIHHYDFYRIENDIDLHEIDLAESFDEGITIIEWADKYKNYLPDSYLEIEISEIDEGRVYKLRGCGTFKDRINKHNSLVHFLSNYKKPINKVEKIRGDASKRVYKRLYTQEDSLILMVYDKKEKKENPSKLSTQIHDYVSICKYLREINVRAPKIYAVDYENQFLVQEDFGDLKYSDIFIKEGFRKLYEPAIDTLINITKNKCPTNIKTDEAIYKFEEYDKKTYLNEVNIFIDWYWPYVKGSICNAHVKSEFTEIWENLLDKLSEESSLVLRDFHSPNLIFQPDGKGAEKCGIIDFQDALIGHPLYDLVSLAQDARITIKLDQELFIIDYYMKDFNFKKYQLNKHEFINQYNILGAQRALKILGVFARLSMSYQKHEYLIHIPRILDYINRNMGNESLRSLSIWLKKNFTEIDYV